MPPSPDGPTRADHVPFDPPGRPVGPDRLASIARAVAERPVLWRARLDRQRTQRTYHEVYTDEHLGVWAISWMRPDHDTGFHDHDRACGAVHVAEGAIRHEHLRLGARPEGRAVPAGEGFAFDETAIHRMRWEPGCGPTVTIHAYSPPLVQTGQYGEHQDALLHRVPTPATDQLEPHGGQGTPSRNALSG
ncbi:cysteine dioxygenase [Trujillonella humicola]|uniref:cysteine dioxygenase n=1 Tax=Trujillonella humicola TaxID=3383699 RepID=UPI0039061944